MLLCVGDTASNTLYGWLEGEFALTGLGKRSTLEVWIRVCDSGKMADGLETEGTATVRSGTVAMLEVWF